MSRIVSLIIAPNYAAASLVARTKGLGRNEWRFVLSVQQAYGFRGTVYTYHGRRDHRLDGWTEDQNKALDYLSHTSGVSITGVPEGEL